MHACYIAISCLQRVPVCNQRNLARLAASACHAKKWTIHCDISEEVVTSRTVMLDVFSARAFDGTGVSIGVSRRRRPSSVVNDDDLYQVPG